MKESTGTGEVAGEQTRDSPTESDVQEMQRWNDRLPLPTARK